MGADLYIESVIEENKKYNVEIDELTSKIKELEKNGKENSQEYINFLKAQIEVCANKTYSQEGFFRDSYNDYSIMWNMGLSWWKDVENLLDENRRLQKEGINKLIEMIEKSAVKLPDGEKLKMLRSNKDFSDCQFDTEFTNKFYNELLEKKVALLRFLRNALSLNQPILCSIC